VDEEIADAPTSRAAASRLGLAGELTRLPTRRCQDRAVSDRLPRPLTHPEHDAVAREIRSWFTTSAPEIGYEVGECWFGYLSELSGSTARLILLVDDPGHVPAALAEARAASGNRGLTIWVDDRDRAARLDAALRDCGCRTDHATTHLALVGAMTSQPGPGNLMVETIGEARLEEWAAVKLRCFDDTEAAPSPGRLAREVEAHRAELALTVHQFGLIDGEPVGVLAFYAGAPDQLVFNLGTRVPCRGRGIAQAMLARWAAAGQALGCRSLIINADDGGRPAALYRRLGFVDEIYWYRKYELDAGTPVRNRPAGG
jgi:ribosomal protein S18 acetylase RimI-like enzyme